MAAGLVLPVVSWGQDPARGGLTVVTTPPGAEVILEGEADLYGISPVTFSFPTLGEYSLTVRKHGYEDYKSSLLLDPAKPQQVLVGLSPKTAMKAGVRSMLIPGWGQRYSGNKNRGLLIGALFVGSALLLLDAHNTFQSREDEYLQRLAEYDHSVSRGGAIQELSPLYDALAAAQSKAYDAESRRRIAAGVVIGVWGLNVVDALLSAPGERATFSVKGVAVEPSAGADGLRVTLSKAF